MQDDLNKRLAANGCLGFCGGILLALSIPFAFLVFAVCSSGRVDPKFESTYETWFGFAVFLFMIGLVLEFRKDRVAKYFYWFVLFCGMISVFPFWHREAKLSDDIDLGPLIFSRAFQDHWFVVLPILIGIAVVATLIVRITCELCQVTIRKISDRKKSRDDEDITLSPKDKAKMTIIDGLYLVVGLLFGIIVYTLVKSVATVYYPGIYISYVESFGPLLIIGSALLAIGISIEISKERRWKSLRWFILWFFIFFLLPVWPSYFQYYGLDILGSAYAIHHGRWPEAWLVLAAHLVAALVATFFVRGVIGHFLRQRREKIERKSVIETNSPPLPHYAKTFERREVASQSSPPPRPSSFSVAMKYGLVGLAAGFVIGLLIAKLFYALVCEGIIPIEPLVAPSLTPWILLASLLLSAGVAIDVGCRYMKLAGWFVVIFFLVWLLPCLPRVPKYGYGYTLEPLGSFYWTGTEIESVRMLALHAGIALVGAIIFRLLVLAIIRWRERKVPEASANPAVGAVVLRRVGNFVKRVRGMIPIDSMIFQFIFLLLTAFFVIYMIPYWPELDTPSSIAPSRFFAGDFVPRPIGFGYWDARYAPESRFVLQMHVLLSIDIAAVLLPLWRCISRSAREERKLMRRLMSVESADGRR